MSTVRLEGSWYIDQANNRWSTQIFTEEEAVECSSTLINCSDCKGCKDCRDCDSCIECRDCSDCRDCSGCSNCRDCSNCGACWYCIGCCDCSHCGYCSNCIDCRSCIECIDCRFCRACRHCSKCSDCSNCRDCSYCIRCSDCRNCRNCHDFSENPQCITGWRMGSRNDTPRVYWITPGTEQCIVGCFKGTLSDLEGAVRSKHRDNPKHLSDYLKFIEVVRYYQKSCKDSEVVN